MLMVVDAVVVAVVANRASDTSLPGKRVRPLGHLGLCA